ncbi:hypothetical protein CFIMG_008518RA00001 [Ceratocystis fimbriata CBS 114723]|uniref:Uncharacterized protein n=1 Tax=Ceratocystis fimbriata CBS 114723 TaxID=1035309 RepID=A0A2C5XJG1_9PEZI|nr:hypothetical protein CFIMG_008518RA00001 [Ceratocystis fimbriata CBS 114723]
MNSSPIFQATPESTESLFDSSDASDDESYDERLTLDYEFERFMNYPSIASESTDHVYDALLRSPSIDGLLYLPKACQGLSKSLAYDNILEHARAVGKLAAHQDTSDWISSTHFQATSTAQGIESQVKEHMERYLSSISVMTQPSTFRWCDHVSMLKASMMKRAWDYCSRPAIDSIEKIVARLDHPLRNLHVDKIPLPNEKDFVNPIFFSQQLLTMLSVSDAPRTQIHMSSLEEVTQKPAFVLYGYSPDTYATHFSFSMTLDDTLQSTPVMPFLQVVFDSNPNEAVHCSLPIQHRMASPIRSVEGLNYSATFRSGNSMVPGDCFFTICIDSDNSKVRIYVSSRSDSSCMYSACLAGFIMPDRIAMQQLYILFRSIVEWGCLERLSLIAHNMGVEPTGVVLDYERFSYWLYKDTGPKIERAVFFPRPEWMSVGMLGDIMKNHWPEGSSGPMDL